MHLAELHALAARLGVPRYRMLRREELIDEIVERGGEALVAEVPEPVRAERPPEEEPAEPRGEARRAEEAEGEPVTGVLDVLPQRYGFLRLGGLEPAEGDVYISASQIRRCELRPGDDVSGPARPPRRGERHRALVHVNAVNGAPPDELAGRPDFDSLTPIPSHRPLRLERTAGPGSERLSELMLGQRVLITGDPGSCLATLREVAGALPGDPEAIALLVDARPEEVTEWRRGVPGVEVAAVTADHPPGEQAGIAGLAIARAKRRVETGADVVLLIDSLTRLALAYDDPLHVKTFFGAGRELEEEDAGSLTVIATLLVGTGVEHEEQVRAAVLTTENVLVQLSPAA